MAAFLRFKVCAYMELKLRKISSTVRYFGGELNFDARFQRFLS